MIVGVGTDIIEIARVEVALKSKSFVYRCYTDEELKKYYNNGVNIKSLAGNFAAKEAVAKMFGTGFRGFSFSDIEVLRDDFGKPYVNLFNGALDIARRKGVDKIHVSISNIATTAIAYVVGESF